MKVKCDHRRLLFSNCLNWNIYCDDHTSLSSTTAVQILIISYMISLHGKIWNNKLTLLPMCGFIAQLVRASHRYRGGHGFGSCWSPDFFQASSFQLLKLEITLHFSYTTAVQIWIISYIFHNTVSETDSPLQLLYKSVTTSNLMNLP